MCKSEFFFKVLSLTEQETEVPRDRILGPQRDTETTDARHIIVILLSEAGMYPEQIAACIRKTSRCVRYLMSRNITSQWSGLFWKNFGNRSETSVRAACHR